MDQWVHQARGEFCELAERRCPVIDKLLRDRIIEEKHLPAYRRSLKSVQEPTTGVILQLSEHASEVFSGTSDYYRLTEDFVVAVEERLEN